MLMRFLVIYLVFITRIKQYACSTTKSLSDDTHSEGTETTNTDSMTPETDSEEETLEDNEETTPLSPSSDDATESTATMSKPSCGSFWHYNEVMRCLYESAAFSPPPADCANSSCPAKTCDISQFAHQCMGDFFEVQEWKKQLIQRQAMNPLAVRRVYVGRPIRIRPVGRPKNPWTDEVQKIISDLEHARSREAEKNSDVWRLLLSKNKSLFGHKQRQLIQLMNSTKKFPFSLTTVDEESKNKTAELIKLVQEAEIVPHQSELTKPRLQQGRRLHLDPWVLYLQNQGYIQPALLKNERRYFISNPDVIERYINSRRSRKRRKKGYSTSLESDSEVVRRMGVKPRDSGAESNEVTAVKMKVLEEKEAGKVNYDERSDDYIVSTTKNARDDEPGEWVTTKFNWDDVETDKYSSNDSSSAEKSHTDELAEESAEGVKHHKDPQPAKENTDLKIHKDYQKEVKYFPIHKGTKWHDSDVAVKVESILKEKGLKNKASNAKKDEWGDWAKPERTTYENRNLNDEGLFNIQDEAEKKYATQEANQHDSATRPMYTEKKMNYPKNERERQTTKNEYFYYKDDGYRPGKPNNPSKQERNKAGRLERPERLESSERSERTKEPKNINGYHGLNKPSQVERREELKSPARSNKKKDYEEDYDSKKYTKKDMNIIDGWTKEKEQKKKRHDDYIDYGYTHQTRRDKGWNRYYDRKMYKKMDSNENYNPKKEKQKSHNSQEYGNNDLEKHTINIERIAKGIDVKWSDEVDRPGETKKSNEDVKSENTKISDNNKRLGKAVSEENSNNNKASKKSRPHHDDSSKDWGKGKQADWSQENKENLSEENSNNNKASKKSRPHHDDSSKDWGKGKQADWSQENKENWRDKTGANPKPGEAPTEHFTDHKKKQNKNKEDYDFWNRHAHNDWDRVGVDWNKKDETKRTKKDIFPQIDMTTRLQSEGWDPHGNNDWDKVGVGRGSNKHKSSYEYKPRIQRNEDRNYGHFGYVHTPLPHKEQKSVYDD